MIPFSVRAVRIIPNVLLVPSPVSWCLQSCAFKKTKPGPVQTSVFQQLDYPHRMVTMVKKDGFARHSAVMCQTTKDTARVSTLMSWSVRSIKTRQRMHPALENHEHNRLA